MNNPTIYLDLNEVLADLFAPLGGKAKAMEDPQIVVNSFSPEKLADKIPWTIKGKELWNALKKYHKNIEILSSTGQTVMAPLLRDAKELWVSKNLGPIKVNHASSDKSSYAAKGGVDNILIDNTQSKLDSWESAGGAGILYTGDSAKVSRELDKILGNDRNKMAHRVAGFFIAKSGII